MAWTALSGIRWALAVACLWAVVADEAADEDAIAAGVARATFAKPSYWNAVYTAEPKLSYGPLMRSWHGVGFEQLRSLLEPILREGALQAEGGSALVLGCGDSALPEELVDAGAAKVTGVDFSAELLASMEVRTKENYSQITWLAKDVAEELGVPPGTFDVAVDVGLLDAALLSEDETRAQKMLGQAHKALRPNGTYISVSTETPRFRQPLFDSYPAGGWSTIVESLPRAQSLDPRVLELDPSYTVGSLSVYVSRAVDAEADRLRAEALERAARAAAERAAAAEREAAEREAAERERETAAQAAAAAAEAQEAAAGQQVPEDEASTQQPVEASDASGGTSESEEQPAADVRNEASDASGGRSESEEQPAADVRNEASDASGGSSDSEEQPAADVRNEEHPAAEASHEDQQQQAGDAVCDADSPETCHQ